MAPSNPPLSNILPSKAIKIIRNPNSTVSLSALSFDNTQVFFDISELIDDYGSGSYSAVLLRDCTTAEYEALYGDIEFSSTFNTVTGATGKCKALGVLSTFYFDPQISRNFDYDLVGTTKASPIFNQIIPKYRINFNFILGGVGSTVGITPIFFESAGANSLKNPRFEDIQRWFFYATDDNLEDIL